MAKINVSVSSSSSKPNVTVSKGPVGPQGEQGIQGEAGPQGAEGTVSSVNDIPEFNVDLDTSNLGFDHYSPTSGALVNTISQRYLTWDPESNKIVLAEDANQSGYITGYLGQSSPRPSGQFVTGNVASTEGGSLDGIDTANGVVSINHSGQIDNSLNLYVNGDTRVNGAIQVGTDNATAYSLPSADGTANQILKTDGSGAVSFTGDYLTKSTADVITATKRFNVQQDFVGGVNITNGASINGYTLPTSDGTAGQFLKTDGSGNISFAAASSLALGKTTTTALAGDTTTISPTQASEITANTAKVGITTTQASEISANTAKVGITTQQASDIVANNAKTDTNISNADLTLDDNRTVDMSGNDFIIDPNGGQFEINDSSGLPNVAEIQVGQGNVDIAGTQVSINGIDYPAVDGSAGQFLKTDGSGNLSFSDVAQSIDGLTDVDTTTTAPADGQALVWNDTNSEWEPGSVGIDGITSAQIDKDNLNEWRVSSSSQMISVGSWGGSGITKLAFNEGHPRDLFFKPDGTRMFVVGNGRDDIQSVDLPTAWDLSSIPYTATVTSVDIAGSSSIGGGGHEGSLYGLYVASDPNNTNTYGKKFFVAGDQRNEVQEYTCTTAWDLSTMSTVPTDFLSVSSVTGNPYGVEFKPDGSVMYVSSTGTGVFHFDLSTNWDLSTAVHNSSKSVTLSLVDTGSNTEGAIRNLTFSNDGTKVYIVGDHRECLWQLNLSTPWDISTYSQDEVITLSSGYIENAFGSSQAFNSASGVYNTDDYFFILFNHNDQIIRIDKKGALISFDGSYIETRPAFMNGLTSFGGISGTSIYAPSAGSRFGGNTYIGGQLNVGTINGSGLYQNSGGFHMGAPFIRFSGRNQANQGSGVDGVHLRPTDGYTDGLYNLYMPNVNGVLKTDQDTYYLNRFDSESTSKVTGATEDIEYYYTARTDGQGSHKRLLGAFPASGQTLTRTSYYSDKAFADPDTASDWTQGTVYSSTALDSAISQSTDTLLNAQSTGTPPLSTKIVVAGYLGASGLVVGDSNGFGGTSVAYSLRLLNNVYGGAAIRVVNDSDVEADIGFDSNYELDTTALLNHCGSGDGYLVKWYDQAKGGSTGDGNDATWESSTSYSSRKPQIVSSGSVILDNGKPCIETIDAGMKMESEFSASGEFDFFAVCQKTINNGNHGMLFGTQTGNDNRVWFRDYQMNFELNNGETDSFRNFNDDGSNTLRWYQMGQMVFNVRRDSSNVNTAQRNTITSTHSYTRDGSFRGDRILNNWNNKQYSFGGNVQEIIIFDGDKSSERSAIQSNLNTYYSVY